MELVRLLIREELEELLRARYHSATDDALQDVPLEIDHRIDVVLLLVEGQPPLQRSKIGIILARVESRVNQVSHNLPFELSRCRGIGDRCKDHGSKFVRAESLPRCSTVPQRLRSTKVSIRSRSSACSRLVSTERPHKNLTVRRIRQSLRPLTLVPLAMFTIVRSHPQLRL